VTVKERVVFSLTVTEDEEGHQHSDVIMDLGRVTRTQILGLMTLEQARITQEILEKTVVHNLSGGSHETH
jgi:hypothetical protein